MGTCLRAIMAPLSIFTGPVGAAGVCSATSVLTDVTVSPNDALFSDFD